MYSVYIVRCKDRSLYTGSTTDVKRRVEEHNASKRGARYTSSRRPVTLVYSETFPTLSAALKREAEIKRLTRDGKMALIGR